MKPVGDFFFLPGSNPKNKHVCKAYVVLLFGSSSDFLWVFVPISNRLDFYQLCVDGRLAREYEKVWLLL